MQGLLSQIVLTRGLVCNLLYRNIYAGFEVKAAEEAHKYYGQRPGNLKLGGNPGRLHWEASGKRGAGIATVQPGFQRLTLPASLRLAGSS